MALQEEGSRVEAADRLFLRNAQIMLERIQEVSDLAALRHKTRVLPSHWWWNLDEISREGIKVSSVTA